MPSRKVISALIVCAALVASIIILFEPAKITPVKLLQNAGTLRNGVQITADSSINTDWQKELQNLSGNLPEASTTDNLTDEFSRSFMANYLALKQSGGLDQNSASTLVDKSINFIETSGVDSNYTLKDIVVSPDNSQTAISAYGNALGLALKINKPKGDVQNEIVVFRQMLETKDSSLALTLQNISKIYNNTISSLLDITVPSSFAQKHLQFVNALKNEANNVQKMSEVLNDPLKSLQAITGYQSNYMTLMQTKKDIEIKILQARVNYKQGDNGYYFFFGI